MSRRVLAFVFVAAASPVLCRAQSFDDLMRRGRAQMDSNKTDNAAKTFEKAIKLEPQNAEAHFQLGRAVGANAENASVFKQPFLARRIKAEFEKTVDLDPKHLSAREGLVQFYLRAPGVMGGSVAKAREQASEISRLHRLRGHLVNANIALHEKDTAAAGREYRAAATEFPDSLNAVTSYVSFLSATNRAEESFAPLDRYLATKPNDRVALYWVARTAAVTGKQLDRGEQILRAMLVTPVDTGPRVARENIHFRLGDIAAKRGDNVKARSEYQEALTINPKFEPAKKALSALPR